MIGKKGFVLTVGEAMEEEFAGGEAIQYASDRFLCWETSCHSFCPPAFREESVEESFGDLLRRWCLTSIVACLWWSIGSDDDLGTVVSDVSLVLVLVQVVVVFMVVPAFRARHALEPSKLLCLHSKISINSQP